MDAMSVSAVASLETVATVAAAAAQSHRTAISTPASFVTSASEPIPGTILRTRSLDEAAPRSSLSTIRAADLAKTNTNTKTHTHQTDVPPGNTASALSHHPATLSPNPAFARRTRSLSVTDDSEPSFEDEHRTTSHLAWEMSDLPPPCTTRKASRRVTDPTLSRTPLRPRMRGSGITSKKMAIGKLTPASARRHRKSPMRRVPPLTPHRASTASGVLTAPCSSGDCMEEDDCDDNDNNNNSNTSIYRRPLQNIGTVKKMPKLSLGTVATSASSTAFLETTHDTADSDETNETSTPFRFTSFPASLPRIPHHPSTLDTHDALLCPATTVKKRMTFDEDDKTNNTSVSSIHDDEDFETFSAAAASPTGTPVARTRLNFASVLSPFDASTRAASIPLQESDRTRSLDSGDRLPPSRHSNFLSFADHDHIKPKTPREVQLLFHLDAAPCSPIPGIPEEEGDLSSSDRSDGNDNREVLTSTSRLSQSSTATTESGSRQRRPMPDMSAFDSEALFSRDRSSLGVAASSSTPPASPKLLCPPTPVRTPAWAHADTAHASLGGGFAAGGQSKLSRCNSLTVTKVLATCPLQVLEGRSSLENSLLEEEGGRNESNMSSVFGSPHHLDGSDHDTTIDADMEDAGSAASGEPSPFKQRQSLGEVGAVVSMTSSFEVLSTLGSGTFADVYKVRSKTDGSLYAIKRNRRQFRGKRDRDQALAEVRYMQRLQSIVATAPSVSTQNSSYCLHVLFFYQAWQEDGHFFCQTELCCRDTCRDLIDSVKTKWNEAKLRYPSVAKLEHSGRLVPESSVWKVCHDACAGLSHIHSHGLVHLDIKPSNIFFVEHPRYGPMCKIGDFGMTCEIGSSEDGQEGDQLYMSLESLTNSARHPSADIFSLGLTLYELASHSTFEVPVEGARWHELRSGRQVPNLPESRSADLVKLIGLMLSADVARRPTADLVLGNDQVLLFGNNRESFLIEYLRDASAAERAEVRGSFIDREDQTPRIASRSRVCSPPVGMMPPMAPMLYSP